MFKLAVLLYQSSSACPRNWWLHMTSFAAFSTPSLFLSLVCTIPKFEKILSIEVELDGKFNKVIASWQRSELMPHFECRTDFHQATGCIWSIHTGEFKEFGTWLSLVWNWHIAGRSSASVSFSESLHHSRSLTNMFY